MALLKMLEEFIDQIVVDYFLTEKQREEIMIEAFEELWVVEERFSEGNSTSKPVNPLYDKFFHTNFPFL